jgi:large subunit ribosomal protein L25
MKSQAFSAFPRTQKRRKGARALRAAGRIPANIYGKSAQTQNLELDAKAFEVLVHQTHSEIILVDLEIAGDGKAKRLALVQDVQHHPLSGKVLHVDFHEVNPDEKVTVSVPVETSGIAEGVREGGGVLEHVLFKLRVRALPKDLPEQITVDVSHLKVGQALHIGEVPSPEGVEVLGDKSLPVFSVAAPVTETVEAAPAAGAGEKLPEMIKEKKEDGATPADAKAGDKSGEKAGEKAEKKAPEKKK